MRYIILATFILCGCTEDSRISFDCDYSRDELVYSADDELTKFTYSTEDKMIVMKAMNHMLSADSQIIDFPYYNDKDKFILFDAILIDKDIVKLNRWNYKGISCKKNKSTHIEGEYIIIFECFNKLYNQTVDVKFSTLKGILSARIKCDDCEFDILQSEYGFARPC